MPRFDLQVYYSLGNTTDAHILHPSNTDEALCKRADGILHIYAKLLYLLSSPLSTDYPGVRRIQHAFAAACDSYSPEEWQALSTESKDLACVRYQRFFQPPSGPLHNSRLPALVIYLGGPCLPGSVSYQLQMASTQPDSSQLWDDGWNSDNSSGLPLSMWAWNVQDLNAYDGVPIIMIAGFYAVRHIEEAAKTHSKQSSENLELIDLHLMVVLFHELIHIVRIKVHGFDHLTPPKCIDHARGNKGEAGRLGEYLAFGAVVNLYMEKGDIFIFVCDTDDENTPYRIELEDVRVLFYGKYGKTLSLHTLRTTSTPLSFIPARERYKSKTHDDTSPSTMSSLRIPQPGAPQVVEFDPQGSVTPITGPLAEKLREVARLNSLRHCIEVPSLDNNV